ncbi:hypothetical protein [Paenibacillus tarimensis]|uniref:hypothetical protein n=1 Tax=Paenibacillus tarimensis TaxID=416012 RepID=UPI001F1DED13|nr:hypothetical protein [Paenibacillus tarimensis]MCF2946470.1 hypothetical protein [Paenibacillus tarimensis]
MSIIFERHEPAITKNGLIGWIKLNQGNSFSFAEPPNDLHLINRYLIEYKDIVSFIDLLTKDNFYVYSCIYPETKSQYLTRIQKLSKGNKLKKQGWEQNEERKGLFLKPINYLSHEEIEIIDDYYQDSLFVISNAEAPPLSLSDFLFNIEFLSQPASLGSYYPTEKLISSLIQNDKAIIYLKRDFFEENHLEERNIFVCYSPWVIVENKP